MKLISAFVVGLALGALVWYWIERAWSDAEDWERDQ